MDKNKKDKNTEADLVKEFDSSSSKKSPRLKISAFIIFIAVIGVFSGLLIAKGTSSPTLSSTDIESPTEIEAGMTFGFDDDSTFKDIAEGVLKEGGIDGEGQYHLERPGGESKYVYLTSSAVDLSLFIDREIKVWGETFASEKAGWLMDVGKVEVIE